MENKMSRNACNWAAVIAALLFIAGTAAAAPTDFRFEPVTPNVKAGDATIVVQLLDVRAGKPVTGAILILNKVEMVMQGMAPVAVKATPTQVDEHGHYRFEANLGMAGEWRVSLAAKVQGESETVRGTVVIQASP
jgi:YtkA-like